MERVWAPWRMELIRSSTTGCFFCEYARQNLDKENLVLERGKSCFVVMNRYPYTNGHLMIAPYQHIGDLSALTSEVRAALMDYTARWQMILTKAMKAQGFNIGINLGKVAGAGVADHLHVHIVPRWLGDTNFMSVVGEIRVINQALEELYQDLQKVLHEIPQ